MIQTDRRMDCARRVVVTGLGIVSSLGNGASDVVRSLRESRSGLVYEPQMRHLGYRCCVCAPIDELDTSIVPHWSLRMMSRSATYAAVAALEAVTDAGLDWADLAGERIGIVLGSGGGGVNEVPRAETVRDLGLGLRRLGGAGVIRIMSSGVCGNLAAVLRTGGRVASLSAACSTGLYNIGYAFELIRYGEQDLCITGSSEEMTWRQVGLSADNGRGMPAHYNDRPQEACRPFDRDRQGLVISEGAGALVLESMEHAVARGARIYAEVVGYGAACDGLDMFQPSGVGLRAAFQNMMNTARELGVEEFDYVNAHAAGTAVGDPVEASVLRELFGRGPMVSSTKGIAGHGQGATGAQEAVYTLLMMHHGFVAPTVNLKEVDPACDGIRHVRSLYEGSITTAISTNNGLGGSNACIAFRRP